MFCAIKDFSTMDDKELGRFLFLKKVRLTIYDNETSIAFREEFDSFVNNRQLSLDAAITQRVPSSHRQYEPIPE